MVSVTARTKTRRRIVVGSVVLLLLLLIVGGSWALLRLRALNTDPRQQAVRFFAALKAQDWKTVYALSEGAERNFISAAAYESKMKQMMGDPLVSLFFAGLIGKAPTEVGQPVIHGNEASVPVTWTRTTLMQIAGQEYHQSSTSHVDMPMKKIRGIWKVADDPQGIGGLVALNYHFEFSGKAAEGERLVIQQGGRGAPESGAASWQNRSLPSSSSESGLQSNTAPGPASQPAETTNANATGSPTPPPVLEDTTHLGSPVDNSSANSTNANPPVSSYGSAPVPAPPPNGAGTTPTAPGSGKQGAGNGSSPANTPDTGETGDDNPSTEDDSG